MLPGVTADQKLFAETAERFIRSTCPVSTVRRVAQREEELDGGYFTEIGELGWLALFVPEEHGGGSPSGQPVLDAGLIAEQRGRYLQPGPIVGSNVAALAITLGGTGEQRALLDDLAGGKALAAWALGDPVGGWGASAGVEARRGETGFVLSGTKGLVQDAHLADWFLVSAAVDGRPALFWLPDDVPGLSVEPLAGLDLTHRYAELVLRDVAVPASAVVGQIGGDDLGERLLQVATVLTVAEMVGAISELFAMTLEHARNRAAFGRVIGSFQAVKHQLADLSLAVECSHAIATGALTAVQERAPDAAELASAAKAFVGDAAIDVSQGCLQLHGGIGYTWEHDLHLYLRRLATDRVVFGDPAWHRERICRLHGL
ncbi:acyl-CoA dehydrogenase family protein [Frankia sp. QA3]|uniref:acyl-CoA dehydrogenase family protein n=1 Tax=Frankia sp. QA3 TaxID=710111 RepID=UPI000269C0C9|nr:acyl-CoA dehydrogenase family protein [Frankia sp. QA3]EIV91608.1 acyl-CoA dehydrogenase [Frankia sp. QA3]